jgi:hypothetical protein
MIAPEHEKLIARATAGTLTPTERACLISACEGDPALLEELQRHVEMERLLAFHIQESTEPAVFAGEVLSRLDDSTPQTDDRFAADVLVKLPPPSATPRGFRPTAWWLAAAAILVVSGLAVLQPWTARAVPTVARVDRIEAATWSAAQAPLVTGQSLGAGTVRVESGFVALRFTQGAEVILEGPAELELIGPNEAALRRGSATAHVPPSAVGFTVHNRAGRVVDLGTRFGMRVAPDGGTEVHVIEGSVLANATGGRTRELREHQAVRLNGSATDDITALTHTFVTALPERRPGPVNFLHWSLDENSGRSAAHRGGGLGAGSIDYHAIFRANRTDAPGVKWAPGVFGSGVFLDGNDGWLETGFPGIGGSHARTVAMWVKLPADWDADHGYALASWGTFPRAGEAWQISINPGDPADLGAPIGRLRVGTHLGFAVGTTDLRDGNWHHVAVVMYAGEQPDVATHLLLYVDGRLEPAAVKTARSINTNITSADAVRFQLGRNLHSPTGDTGRLAARRHFFRGWLDEVFVFDEALTLEQVRELMARNACAGLADESK